MAITINEDPTKRVPVQCGLAYEDIYGDIIPSPSCTANDFLTETFFGEVNAPSVTILDFLIETIYH